ncbi:MAG: tetratricopeptide repeat protein [Desulfobacteraceae bacterium]|nr:tetratricopeptide repeat protein [Desulfobacteraceae bacterium]
MPTVRIRQTGYEENRFEAVVTINDEGEHPTTITDPFSKQEEKELEWYFEEYLKFPFVDKVRFENAAKSVTRYGESLFRQVFRDPDLYAEYKSYVSTDIDDLRFEIVGSPEFHALHWESLKDPKLHRAWSLQGQMVRKNRKPQYIKAEVKPSPTINLLIVTARPHGKYDVGYRTVSRPLVEALRQSKVPVNIRILRPGTYEELNRHLEGAGAGYYHVIHFDMHGSLMTYEKLEKGVEADQFLFQTRYGREDIEEYEGLKAFLFMEGSEENSADPVEAGEMAQLLINYQIPVAILNACQSGKQVGTSETSLGSRLMEAGMQMVVAMGYTVTVSAAVLMMTQLYEQLFGKKSLSHSIRLSRLELHNKRERKAYFNQTIELKDWILPVVYQNREVRLEVQEMTPEQIAAHYERKAGQYPFPKPVYDFWGRDLDILEIEKRLLSRCNLLLVRGMGGAGKTTLLHHMGAWWQTTQFVEKVFYFGYDQRAWTRQQIMMDIAEKLLSPAEFAGGFRPLGEKVKQTMLCERLRGERHLLMLDNLESITGAHLAVKNTLPEKERDEMREFLSELRDGKTLVLLGSRGGEEWLGETTFGDNVYDLSGLDPEAGSGLADKILEQHGVVKYREDKDFQALLKLLQWYPLVLEVILSNLKGQTPGEILKALEAGDVNLDKKDAQGKTESILRCIEYSHSNLSSQAQDLLSCFAPFTGVIFIQGLRNYIEKLKTQPALPHLPFDSWQNVLQEAANWGLVFPHPEIPDFLQLQPVFPYFLKTRLNNSEQAEIRCAVETAFREHYDDWSNGMYGLMESKEPYKKQLGYFLAKMEYENLMTALNLALDVKVSIGKIYRSISRYLDITQDNERGLELGNMVFAKFGEYPPEILIGALSVEFVSVIDDIAKRHLLLKQYSEAEKYYQKVLALSKNLENNDEKQKQTLISSGYSQLGYVAQEQRQWQQAEEYYKKALKITVESDQYRVSLIHHNLGMVTIEQQQWQQAEEYLKESLRIKIELNDQHSQSLTYHELGVLSQKQRKWKQAEEYYKKALQITIEFDDRYNQSHMYHNLGEVAIEQQQWEQAKEYCKNALTIFIEFNDQYKQARTYHSLGMIAEGQQQRQQAEEYYQNALRIFTKFNDQFSQALTYYQLGIIAQKQRQRQQAEEYFKNALTIFIKFKERCEQAKIYGQLGLLSEEQRQWEQACKYLLQALKIFVELNDQDNLSKTSSHLIRIRQTGEVPELLLYILDVFGKLPEVPADIAVLLGIPVVPKALPERSRVGLFSGLKKLFRSMK